CEVPVDRPPGGLSAGRAPGPHDAVGLAGALGQLEGHDSGSTGAAHDATGAVDHRKEEGGDDHRCRHDDGEIALQRFTHRYTSGVMRMLAGGTGGSAGRNDKGGDGGMVASHRSASASSPSVAVAAAAYQAAPRSEPAGGVPPAGCGVPPPGGGVSP